MGIKVSRLLLRIHFWKLLKISKPEGYEKFGCSQGWCTNFCKRYRISRQCRNNNKKLPVAARLPQIMRFHKWLLHVVQMTLPHRCPIYGRYPARFMFHMDQVPLEFCFRNRRSLNPMADECWIFQPGSGLEKRQCSLIMCVRPEGDQIVKPFLIFRGTGKRLPREEMEFYIEYCDEVGVLWQANAWADGVVMIEWLDSFVKSTSALGGDVLLGMDNHGAQKTKQFRKKMLEYGIQPVYTPPYCTDCVSPCDHHLGAWIKEQMGVLFQDEILNNYDHWVGGGANFAGCRRKLIFWFLQVWKKFVVQKAHTIRQAFISTGFLIAMNGMQNHFIKLQGYKGKYDFTNAVPCDPNVDDLSESECSSSDEELS